MVSVYYNEIEKFPCEVIRKNIREGNIPDGRVDERDIREVTADDLAGFRQVHLFAGIGGAAYAARLAGAERVNLWTFGFPCQDISCAGKGEGIEGERSGLFFQVARLLRDSPRRPDWLLAENVPALRKRGADRVLDELEGLGYAVRPVVVGAEHVGAPHKRHRAWFMGYAHPDGAKYRDLCDTLRHLIGDGAGDEAGRQEFQYGVDRPSLADPIRLDGGGGGEVSFGEAAERTAAEGTGRGELADTRQPRLAGRRELPIGTGSQVALPAGGGGALWPSRPGEPQYAWEAPRLVELPLGCAASRVSPQLVQHILGALEYATSEKARPDEVLRILRWADDEEAIRGTVGGHGGVSAEEVLRRILHGEADGNGFSLIGHSAESDCEGGAAQASLRGVRVEGEFAAAPQRRGCHEQLGRERGDAVCSVPREVALAERKAKEAIRRMKGHNRNALKAYGNSWVPACAALVLRWIAWADEQLKEAR